MLRLEGRPAIVGLEVSIHLLGRPHLRVERTDHDYWELQPLCLMDRHHLDVPFGERLVGVLVLIDAAVVKQSEETIEEVIPLLSG
jgi:hypothetical protein